MDGLISMCISNRRNWMELNFKQSAAILFSPVAVRCGKAGPRQLSHFLSPQPGRLGRLICEVRLSVDLSDAGRTSLFPAAPKPGCTGNYCMSAAQPARRLPAARPGCSALTQISPPATSAGRRNAKLFRTGCRPDTPCTAVMAITVTALPSQYTGQILHLHLLFLVAQQLYRMICGFVSFLFENANSHKVDFNLNIFFFIWFSTEWKWLQSFNQKK